MMASQLAERMQTIEVTQPQEAGPLQVFGLRWQGEDGLLYVTLDEAIASKTLVVSEVSEGGSVPTLKVANRAEKMVFLMSGEQLVGAKQNRVLNASIMVPAQTELPIPVSCVEAGRWRYRSPMFASGGTMSHGALRKMMSKQAHEGLRTHGSPTSKQGEVWQEVGRKLGAVGSVSPSAELQQAYADHEYRVSDFLGKLQVPEGCHGVVFVLRGKIAGADIFDKPETLRKLWPKMLKSYALDALEAQEEQAKPIDAENVRRWLHTAGQAKSESFKSPGLGEDVRLEGAEVVGAGLVVEDHPVHVELFTSA
jgi:hypothetical protein